MKVNSSINKSELTFYIIFKNLFKIIFYKALKPFRNKVSLAETIFMLNYYFQNTIFQCSKYYGRPTRATENCTKYDRQN